MGKIDNDPSDEHSLFCLLVLLEKNLAIAPDNDQAHFRFAYFLERAGKDAEALSHYERAVAINPELADAYYNAGMLHWKQGHLLDAKQALSEAVKRSPDDPDAHNVLGKVLSDNGESKEAIDRFGRVIDLARKQGNPVKQAQGLYYFALELWQTGEKERAISAMRQAVDLYAQYGKDDPDARNALGTMLLSKSPDVMESIEDLSDARHQFGKVVELNPNLAEGYYNAGLAEERISEDAALSLAKRDAARSRSMQQYQNAIRKDPFFVQAYYGLGKIHNTRANYDMPKRY